VSSVSASFPSSNTAGNLIIAFVRMSTTTQTVTLTDSAGNSYINAISQTQTTDGHQIYIFYAKNIGGGANTVKATFSAANNHPWLAIYEFAGLSTSTPLDRTAHAQGTNAAANSGATASTTAPNELVFAGLGTPNNYAGSITPGSGYGMQQQNTNLSRAASETAVVSSTGSYSGAFTAGSATNWSAVVATFASGSGSASATPTSTAASSTPMPTPTAPLPTSTSTATSTAAAPTPTPSGGTPITMIQSNATEGSAATSLSASFASGNNTGNLIIAFVRMSSSTQTVTITDTAGNSYINAVSQTQTTDGHQVYIFYARNIVGGANTVKATFSATNNHPWLAVYEFSGLNAANPLDQTAHAQGSNSSPSTGATAPTTHPNELVFTGLGMVNNATGAVTAGSGDTLQQQDQNTSRAANETLMVSSTGSYAGQFSLSSATNWSAVLATFTQ
jgi:hypothetical protein